MFGPGLSTILAALALLMGAALANDSRADSKRPRHPPGSLVQRHAERLGLDEARLAAIEAIVAESGARDQELHDQIDAARQQLRALLSNPSPDGPAVRSQADVIGALEIQARKNRLDAIIRVRALLNSEQLEELMRIREERFSRRHRGLEHCARDLRDLCADTNDGLATVSCLSKRWEEVSEPCQKAFSPTE